MTLGRMFPNLGPATEKPLSPECLVIPGINRSRPYSHPCRQSHLKFTLLPYDKVCLISRGACRVYASELEEH